MGAFLRAKYRKFPVFFPVSREFRRRMVSGRLPAPPFSLPRRETGLHSSEDPLKNAAIPRFSPRNRTGESILLNPAGEPFSYFLWKADTRSGFDEPTWRMECDHKPLTRQKRLDFPASLSPSPPGIDIHQPGQ